MTDLTDQQIADALVEAGILRSVSGDEGEFYNREIMDPLQTPYTIIRDWRVAGACLERMDTQEILIWMQHYKEADSVWVVELGNSPAGSPDDGRNESLPRAICEAFVEALSD